MSVLGRAAAHATARAVDRLVEVATAELPGDVAIEAVDGGVRLAGPRLALRWVEDVRLRGLVATAARA